MTKPILPYHHGSPEEALITPAADIIASKGLATLSLRELGRSAHVSRSAPYHYFKDMGALFSKSVNWVFDGSAFVSNRSSRVKMIWFNNVASVFLPMCNLQWKTRIFSPDVF
jgi:DNA-binding transcriptional regulator YbjK